MKEPIFTLLTSSRVNFKFPISSRSGNRDKRAETIFLTSPLPLSPASEKRWTESNKQNEGETRIVSRFQPLATGSPWMFTSPNVHPFALGVFLSFRIGNEIHRGTILTFLSRPIRADVLARAWKEPLGGSWTRWTSVLNRNRGKWRWMPSTRWRMERFHHSSRWMGEGGKGFK